MTARAEIEEILDAQAWADRNGVDQPVYLPPNEALRTMTLPPGLKVGPTVYYHSRRECPMEDANDRLPLLGWPLIAALSFWGVIILVAVGTVRFLLG